MVKGLENGRLYLKAKFQMNCMNDSSVKSHNINFALSDPKNLKLSTITDQDSLNEVCTDCLELWKAINTVRGIGESSQSPEVQYDVKIAIEDIKSYVRHSIHDVQQRKAKSHVFISWTNPHAFC